MTWLCLNLISTALGERHVKLFSHFFKVDFYSTMYFMKNKIHIFKASANFPFISVEAKWRVWKSDLIINFQSRSNIQTLNSSPYRVSEFPSCKVEEQCSRVEEIKQTFSFISICFLFKEILKHVPILYPKSKTF